MHTATIPVERDVFGLRHVRLLGHVENQGISRDKHKVVYLSE